MINSKREKRWGNKHLFPSKCLHDLGCCYLGTGCHWQRGQREKADLPPCRCRPGSRQQGGSSSAGAMLPGDSQGATGPWDAGMPCRRPGGCHTSPGERVGSDPQPCLCACRRVRAILIPAVCFVLLSCVFSVWWLAVAGFMDGVALPPSLSLQRPQPLGLRHSLFSLPPGAPRPPGGTPTAPPR